MEKKYRLKKNINHYLVIGDLIYVNTKSVKSNKNVPKTYMADAFYLFSAPDQRRVFFERVGVDKNGEYSILEVKWNEYYFKDIVGKRNSKRGEAVYDESPFPDKPCLRLQCWVNGKTFITQQVGMFGLREQEEFEDMINQSYQRLLESMKEEFLAKLKEDKE